MLLDASEDAKKTWFESRYSEFSPSQMATFVAALSRPDFGLGFCHAEAVG